jgi:outer membrane receptor for ferrienterochelin and colicin
VARYKVTNSFQVGLTTFFDKRINKLGLFDKGSTVAVIIKNWALRLYAFNYEIEKRYYWVGLRYTFKTKLSDN